MRRLAGLLAMGAALLAMPLWAGALTLEEVTAEAAVLIDADTGQVLFDKEMHRRMYPASITKIMTGMLTLEAVSADEIVTVSETAMDGVPWDSSHIALSPGERFPVSDGLYALMVYSANDAANVLAEHVAGSQAAFVELMNRRAGELGARNTHFTNAHGLPDDNHYTTAYDMALITRAALDVPEFAKYLGTGRYTMPPTNLQSDERYFHNYMYMLLPDQWPYNTDVTGGKVGYTQEAGHTMSTVASKDGRTLIAVVLKCGIDEKFDDTQLLLDYGFDAFTAHTVSGEAFGSETARLVDAGEVVGAAEFSFGGDIPLLLHNSVEPGSITFRIEAPEEMEARNPTGAVGYVEAPAAAGGLPTVLAEVALDMEVTLFEQELADAAGRNPEQKAKKGLPGFILVPLCVLAGLTGLAFVVRTVRLRNIRRRRQRRAARIRQYRQSGERGL